MKDNNDINILRHSAAHLMARAVMRLFPNVQLAFGPTVENGFYYDFHMEHRLTERSTAKENFPKR
jgi:threonyl-tRNA synthetase